MRRGSGDPTWARTPDGALWRGVRTPEGPASLRLLTRPQDALVDARAWGPGAGWALDSVPGLLGVDDDPAGFEPRHPLLVEAYRRWPGWRAPRSRRVMEALVPAILEQKVTSTEARWAWRDLVRWYGEPAPGPAPEGLRVPPGPEQWLRVPSWDWHRAGVDGKRSRAVLSACAVAHKLEATTQDLPRRVGGEMSVAERALRSVVGIGVWTAAETLQRSHGDADSPSVGDLHVPGLVGHALVGQKVDDAGMLELLEPYAGHRQRAVRLIELAAGAGLVRVPRRAPRFAPRDFRRL
ncbi:DNA-3-methyladenine glycosylase 2 family protein [Motilibacter sp. E257]|uniref:DNA-3-methyladenine glycosylase 2 family protein n=2 Tax=Motilibacter deserti TaxID=2714956 RepID=A0ABX0GTY2_9ACTN|nr:DNA-3-methyladenine glycosylase 2 family protein [Motilibacter deserti]